MSTLVKLFFCGFDPAFNYPLFDGLNQPPNQEEYKAWIDAPLGLGFLKSNCESKNAIIKIVTDKKELNNCDLIGLSATSMGLKEAIHILENTNIPVIIGGACSYWNNLKKYPFKHIVKGDGEYALSEILNGSSQQIVQKEVSNLDDLKFPHRGHLLKHMRAISSRGCNFRCNFCTLPENGSARLHSPEWFINDIIQAHKTFPHIFYLNIQDEIFAWSEERIEKIAKLWHQHKVCNMYTSGIIRARSDQLSSRVVTLLKNMNLTTIQLGVESGSDRMLELMNKQISVDENQRAIDLCIKFGIKIKANFITGAPGETIGDKKLTKDFIKRNKNPFFQADITPFKPFPGSIFYNDENPLEELNSAYFSKTIMPISFI